MPATLLRVPAASSHEADGPALSLASIRARMDEVVVGKRPAGLPMPTGVPPLDVALSGGIPRGRITEVVGMRGAGKTALLRRVVRRVLQTGGWVAWVDARRTLAPRPWAELGSRLVMIRPKEARRSAWCADLLLRSGVFALVVLDGAPLLSRVNGVRLAQLARERDAALVVVADGTQPSRTGGAVRLRVTPIVAASASVNGLRRRSPPSAGATGDAGVRPGPLSGFSVTVEKGGVFRTVEVSCAVVVARRVCADPEIPDRRGVARGTRHSWTPRSHASDDTNRAHPITWGGLGASLDTSSAHAASDPARAAVPDGGTGESGGDAESRRRDLDRRDLDRRTRDWASAKGRRRAAESGYGRRSRRELARERTGALIASHSGQSQGSNGTPRLGRDGGSSTLGVAAGGNGGGGGGDGGGGLLTARSGPPTGGALGRATAGVG